jgi:hypothetical protein
MRIMWMGVRLRSVVRGGMRAVTYRNGVRNSTIYLGTEAEVYEPTVPSEASSAGCENELEPRSEWGPFAGWYQIPRVGLAAIYGAVVLGPVAVPA